MSEAPEDIRRELGEDMTFQDRAAILAEVRTWQEQLVQGMLRAIAIVGFLAAAAGTYDSYTNQEWWTLPFYWGSYAVIVLLVFWKQAPYRFKVWAIIGLVYVLGFTDFVQDGRSGSGRVFMLTVPFLAGLLLGLRESILALILATLTMGGYAWAYTAGFLLLPGDPSSSDLTGWIAGTLTLFMMSTLMVVSLNYLVPRLAEALAQSRGLGRQLARQRDQLEDQVSERTATLARRSTQLQAAAQVARDTVAIQDMERLLEETVHLISDRFGFYHAGIFLLDEAKQYAVLRAASSPGGQRMLARQHRLRVGEAGFGEPVGIVGYVSRQGQPRIALDVGQDAVFFDNPDLPETRSEIALPLRARGEIIGVLDAQSTEPQAFGQEDIAVLQTMADQVAVAFSNARLFEQAQKSLEAERRAYGELSARAWQELSRSRPRLAQRYDPQGILPPDGDWRDEMVAAAQSGQPTPGATGDTPTLAIPLRVRDQVIGVLNAYKPAGSGAWERDETTMLQELVDQLGLAVDSARLYQETQRRAAEEQLLGEVTTRMRETLDVDTVLRTAIQAMGAALGLSRVEVRMGESRVSAAEGGKHVAAD